MTLAQTGSEVTLSVHSWGDAILPEDHKGLFEQYRRTESALSGREKGWGLGLTLVKGIEEAHGGAVQVESAPDKGTTFTVVLPMDAWLFQV